MAESLGDVGSLAKSPAVMEYGHFPAEQRKALGIDDNLIRLSLGIEQESDLIGDIATALAKAFK